MLLNSLPGEVRAEDQHPYSQMLEHSLSKLKRGKYEEAVSGFTDVLRAYPYVAEAYLNRGSARAALNDIDGALKDYEQAIKLNPNALESYLQRGKLYLQLGDRNAAIGDYSEALKLDPKYESVRLLRAQALKQNGDYEGAIKDFEQILKDDQGRVDARQEMADCKLQLNQYDEAIADYEYLLKRNGSRVFHVHNQLGKALLLKGDKDSADSHFNQVVEYYSKQIGRSSKKGWYYLYRGLAYSLLGEKDKALSDMETGASLLETDAQANFTLGHLKLKYGDLDGALKSIDAALKIDPKLYAALLDRADINASKGNFSQAANDLDAALLMSKTADGLLKRAVVELSLGDTSAALQDALEANSLSASQFETFRKSLAANLETNKDASEAGQTQTLTRLALLDMAAGDYQSAESLTRRAIKIQYKKLLATDPQAPYSLLLLGTIYMKRGSLIEAESMFRMALSQLPGPEKKYALFALEDCARLFLASSNLEEAGSILADTRLLRATSDLTERAFSQELSRKAEQAVEAYKQKKKYDRQEELVRKASAARTASPEPSAGEAMNRENQIRINRPIRDKWALIIGTSRFKDSKINLRYAAKDAQDFYNFLVNEREFAADHVKLLTDEAATRANILSLLGSKWLPRVAEKDDLVVIYFSSHGSPSSLDIGGVNYLVAYDTDPSDLYATGIAMQDLARIIRGRVHCDRIMLVLDACHSGVATPSSGKGLVRTGNIDVDQVVMGTGQLVISSSKPDQRSWESSRYEGSVFTRQLINGLRKNGKLTKLGDAYAYLEEEVQREVLRDRGLLQTPIMKSRWRGDDLILGVTPAAPSAGLRDIDLPDNSKVDKTKTGADSTEKTGGKSSASKTKHPAKSSRKHR
jgi:tetratricopeptide (TPR) repeat protein